MPMIGRRAMGSDRQQMPARWPTLALAGALVLAGIVHGALTAGHLAQSPLYGFGFLAAGASQLGFASIVLVRPTRAVYIALIAVTTVLIALYAANVVVGLPLHAPASHHGVATAVDHGHGAQAGGHDGHVTGETDDANLRTVDAVTLGTREPVDAVGLGTQVAQLAAIGLALSLLRRSGSSPSLTSAASSRARSAASSRTGAPPR